MPRTDKRSLREKVPRSSLAAWRPAAGRPDPLEILAAQERNRLQDLLPVRHARMLVSPFAFYRGGAAIMAADLAAVPVTGLAVQLGGDAHLMNFGIFATPERNVVFDVNDFDETLPGPWEWDVLRLCASLPLAGRASNIRKSSRDDAVFAAAKTYGTWMRRYAQLSPLEVWYARIDVTEIIASYTPGSQRRDWQAALRQANDGAAERMLPKITTDANGSLQFVDRGEYFRRIDDRPEAAAGQSILQAYRESLLPSIRTLCERYTYRDIAMKVVGVGSVGTLCLVVLLVAGDGSPLLLQLKEAQASVLEAYLRPSVFPSHGQRVVNGARLMQAASDFFLGWVGFDGRDFYVRQLADMKGSVDLESIAALEFEEYAAHCAWTLARAHARSGDPQAIAGYLGRGDAFAEAMVPFARSYADQTERDYERFARAVRSGAIAASA